ERMRRRLDTQDFANFDYLTGIISIVPERTGGYSYGLQYLQLFTEPIPRILWRGKPAGAPFVRVNLNAHANFVGLTLSLPGDGWISGGWLGVVVTMAVAGTFAGLAHRWFWRHSERLVPALFYISGLAMAPQWYRDGGISIFKFLLYSWLPLVVWLGMD